MRRAGARLLIVGVGVAVYLAVRSAWPGAIEAPTKIRRAESEPASASELVSTRASSLPAPRRDVTEIQRRLNNGEAGTYIREILRLRDGHNARWPDRQGTPLRVWIQPTSTLADFEQSDVVRVRHAFERWMQVGVPVTFAFVEDSTQADIPVVWVEKFDDPISGRTRWTHDQHWWIVDASVQLALHHQTGVPLGPDAVAAMAIHEVGHVLGLDHTSDATSIMAPRVRVRELSQADERTALLMYSIPPGSVTVR